MTNPFALIYRHRNILRSITINEIKQRYAASILGGVWVILNPLLFLSAYFLVYISIFKIRLVGIDTFDYVLIIFSGLIPWLGFSEAIGTSVSAVTTNSSLIKNTLFPIELLPIKNVFSSMVTQIVGLLMLIILLAFQHKVGSAIIIIPLLLVLQILFTTGLAWILSSFNVFFRDLGQVINIILILLMLVSPIAYTNDMLSENMRSFMQFNPMYYMINLYRETIIYNTLPDLNILAVFFVISILFFLLGYFVFSRLKVVFSDYV